MLICARKKFPAAFDAVRKRLGDPALRFRDDEFGGILPFVIVLFLAMVVSTGMAIDFIRHEMARADLQNALDRGVLAATDTEQSLSRTQAEAESLIADYMRSRSYKVPELQLNVNAPQMSGGRVITANAQYTMRTFFLRLLGTDTMIVPARTQAQQAAQDVEISLILDVSNSMTTDSTWTQGTRLSDLQKAAKDFVNTVLTEENKDRVAISIIPYSAQVNVSADMIDAYNLNRHHWYGNCVNFSPSDYQTTEILTSTSLPQTQHFADATYTQVYYEYVTTYRWYRTSWGWRQYPVRERVRKTRQVPSNYICPDDKNAILPYSNNLGQLHSAIENLQPEGWTAAYVGMKWGVALLDPSARPMVNELIGEGKISNDFQDWPRSWDSRQTRKVIVLMTDGRNTRQYRVDPSTYASETPDFWNVNAVPSHALELEVDNDNDGLGDDYLKDICDEAKTGGNAIIYTIGFELFSDPNAAAVLADCASSPSTHYMVESVNLDLAFSNIAAQIEALKLTQ